MTVVGGEHGIEVDDAENVVIDSVRVEGASLDGINARRSSVRIEDCTIESPPGSPRGSTSRSPPTST